MFLHINIHFSQLIVTEKTILSANKDFPLLLSLVCPISLFVIPTLVPHHIMLCN